MTKTKFKGGISLCMIVRDEAHCIETVLSTTRPHVEEVVLVDTGSTDGTVGLAKPYVDILEHFIWIDDFSAARNFSISLASQPWILVLDADEVIAPQDFSTLRQLIESDTSDGFYLTQRLYGNNNLGDEAEWKVADTSDPFSKHYRGYSENHILRLFRNKPSIQFENRVHEVVDQSIDESRIEHSTIAIHHYHENPQNNTEQHVLRNLAIQEELIRRNEATARDYLSAGAAHLRRTKNFGTATEYLTKALEMGAPADGALEALAEAYYRDGKLREATNIYGRLYETNLGSSAVLNNLSNWLIRAGKLRGGAKLLEELLQRGIVDPVRKQRIEQNLEAVRNAMHDEPEADE